VSSVESVPETRLRPRDAIGGLLAMASIVLSAIACGFGLLLEVDARPSRTAPAAVILALVASRMTTRFTRLAFAAVVIGIVAWFVGMTVAVVTENPLW
jgi:ABC-type Mn2+/Zn2+ transport system permease subunit